MLSGLASLFSGQFLAAFWGVIFGIAIVYYCTCKADGSKVRWNAKFIGILILVYQLLQIAEHLFGDMMHVPLQWGDMALAVVFAAALMVPQVPDKPLVAAIGCFVVQALELVSGIQVLIAAVKNPAGIGVFLAVTMFLPAVFGLIFFLRGRKMLPAERKRYVF